MSRYILLTLCTLLAMNTAWAGGELKLSPDLRFVQARLQQMMDHPEQDVSFPEFFRGAVQHFPNQSSSQQEPLLSVVITHESTPEALRATGFEFSTVTRSVGVVRVPLSRLNELKDLPGLTTADISHPFKLTLDDAMAEAGGHTAHGAVAPPYPLSGATGDGVFVGIIDSGIDHKHDDFKDAGGNTRISFIWDQTVGGSGPEGFNYGREWTATQIDANQSTQRDFDGHGTHVTGIAVGDGSATGNAQPQFQYIGVAPEAAILMVKSNLFTDEIIDGVSYLSGKADDAGMPIAINMSLGSQFGPHDGTSPLALAMDDLSGPGVILVASAGNESNSDVHAGTVLTNNTPVELPLKVNPHSATTNSDYVWMEAWYPGDDDISFTITSPNGSHSVSAARGGSQQLNTASGTLTIENGVASTVNGENHVCMILWDQAGTTPASGEWSITMERRSSNAVPVDVYIAQSTLNGNPPVFEGPLVTNSKLVGAPASADSVLAVGSYITKNSWVSILGEPAFFYPDPNNPNSPIPLNKLSLFSSPGPRRDGALKPDISAPGQGIVSARSEEATVDNSRLMPDGVHWINQGTSQASPMVTGTVALILERNPTYAMKEVREAITMSARSDNHTIGLPNSQWGYGKLSIDGAADFVVPVDLLSLSISWEQDKPVVRWQTHETERAEYFVERGAGESGPFTAVSTAVTGDGIYTWSDPAPHADQPWYRVRAELRTGGVSYFGPVKLEARGVTLHLLQNVPNPFSAATTISFDLSQAASVRVEVIDVLGRLVTVVQEGPLPQGRHEAVWDGTTAEGHLAAGGVYFTRVRTGSSAAVRRMVKTN